MKVLFLDFDGVINTGRASMQWQNSWRARLADLLMYRIIYKFPRKWFRNLRNRHHEDSMLDSYSLHWIRQLLKDIPELHIVISSVWRCKGLTYLRRMLSRHGIDAHRIISCTPPGDNPRGDAIDRWLKGAEKNPFVPSDETIWEWQKVNPSITKHCFSAFMDKNAEGNILKESYVIVDDDDDFLENQLQRFVQCNGHDGFGYEHYLKIRKLFGTRD